MKDRLKFLIARDTMHQQQRLAVLEELGPEQATNAPGDYENEPDYQQHAYSFLNHTWTRRCRPTRAGRPGARWTARATSASSSPRRPTARSRSCRRRPPEIHAGAEATGTRVGAAAKRFTRALGSVADKVTPG